MSSNAEVSRQEGPPGRVHLRADSPGSVAQCSIAHCSGLRMATRGRGGARPGVPVAIRAILVQGRALDRESGRLGTSPSWASYMLATSVPPLASKWGS